MDGMCDAGRNSGVGNVGGPYSLFVGEEKKAIGGCAEGGYSDGEGVGAGGKLGRYISPMWCM